MPNPIDCVTKKGLPASPVLFVAAAALQRLITPRKTKEEEAEKGELRRHRPRFQGARRAASVALAASSVATMVAGARRMLDAGTTLDPHAPEQATELVTSGPFAYTRNPIYLGWLELLLAHALWLGSARALAPAAAFMAVMDRYQIPDEERALLEKFGRAFEQYCEDVPRWIIR